ncbi:MAG TPA: alpha/beta hydrolase [Candidatus Methylomirabilis sp.]|nr:alpha/beta hydrolase [Candidatus Methylomirabilis sp.]
MPMAEVDGIKLYYEETGTGTPLVFVHEFAGDTQSWHLQVRFFARRYRCIPFNARGYPPSDVPENVSAYSQQRAVDDIKGVLDHLGIAKAHICGLSMGGYAVLIFGLTYPERAMSLTVAGCGYGSVSADRQAFRQDAETVARRFEQEGMAAVARFYSRGPTRVQFTDKDPMGWQEFHDQLARGSAKGHALTLRGVQMTRPSVFDLEHAMARLEVPTLIMTGDEDEPCLEPAIFMKRKIGTSGLVVIPKAGHTINLEEPEAFNRALLDFLTAVDAGRWGRRNAASLGKSAILPDQTPGR